MGTYIYIYTYIHTYIHAYIFQIQFTPLHYAAAYGHGQILEKLLEAKADLCAQDKVSVLKEARLDADRGMR